MGNDQVEAILRSMGDGVVTVGLDGAVMGLNPAAQRLTGWAGEDARGRPLSTVFNLIGESDELPVEVPMQRCVLERRAITSATPARLRSLSGESRRVEHSVSPLFDEGGEIQGVTAIFRDVSADGLVEGGGYSGEKFFRAAFEALFRPTWILSTAGDVIEINRSALAAVDAAAADVVGKPFWEAPWWSRSDGVPDKLRDSIRIAATGGFVRHEVAFRNRNGDSVAVDFSLKPALDEAGKAFALVAEGCEVSSCIRLEGLLSVSARYARNLIESSLDPMMMVDASGNICDVNQATAEMTGVPRSQLVGAPFAECFAQPEQAQEVLLRVFEEERVRDCFLSVLRQRGGMTEVVCNASLYRSETGEVKGAFVVARDITDLRLYESQMRFQASYDALTALPNRTLFRDRLGRALVRARRREGLVGVMFLDLDNFKDINESLGHSFGDDLLKLMARRLGGVLPEIDSVARLGGDEFAVLVEDAADMREVDGLATKLLHAVMEPIAIDGHEAVVSCSIGITLYPFDDSDVDGLLRNADTAMYRAKEEGKNNFQYFTIEMNASIRRRVEIGNRLRHAIRESEFTLHFQPRAELGRGTVVGVEALLRWNAQGLGPVSPAEFVPIAERNGTIVPIGEWVLRSACRQAVQWRESLGTEVAMAVNLSARQFRDVDVVKAIVCALEESGLPAGLLELELTESMLMHDTKRVSHTLQALKEIGVRLAVDDFGTGYSSLNYLKDFPLDYLKVDRSFVTDIPHDRSDKAIVQAIIGMAHSLGLRVIAEGVETAEQLDFLTSQGCDEIQGYYFSRPLPADGLAELLKAGRILERGSELAVS